MDGARASVETAKLMPETKILNELPIGLQVGPLHVFEEPAPLADHLEQPLPRMMILLVRAEVIRQVVNALRE